MTALQKIFSGESPAEREWQAACRRYWKAEQSSKGGATGTAQAGRSAVASSRATSKKHYALCGRFAGRCSVLGFYVKNTGLTCGTKTGTLSVDACHSIQTQIRKGSSFHPGRRKSKSHHSRKSKISTAFAKRGRSRLETNRRPSRRNSQSGAGKVVRTISYKSIAPDVSIDF